MLDELNKLHSELKLAGQTKNQLLSIPAELINYLIALLSDKPILASQFDMESWNLFLSQSRMHGIAPLLYWKIKKLLKGYQPPEEVLDSMHKDFLYGYINSLRIETTLKTILPVFHKSKVSCLILKGPGLTSTLYPHPATRPSCDLDILVKPEDVLIARKGLETIGYQCHVKNFEAAKELMNEDVLHHPKLMPIELHWALFSYPGAIKNLPLEELFMQSDGNHLSLTDNFIHAALHAAILHGQEIALKWIYDLSLLAQEISRLNLWPKVIAKADKMKATLSICKILQLVNFWTGTQVPNTISWPTVSRAEKKAWKHTINRGSSLLSWFKVRFPTHVSFKLKVSLLRYLWAQQSQKLRKYYPSTKR